MKSNSETSFSHAIKKLPFAVSLLIISFIFASVASYYTSPLSRYLGDDAAFFQLVGQGMTKGMLPYRDFFDMKGIYLFFIEYISQLICYGRTGCYLMEVVNFFIILVIIDRIHLISKPDIKLITRYLCLIPYMWIMAITYEGGNLTEEFSLPFTLICVLLCEKYWLNCDEAKHPPFYGAVYGFCFGVIAFIRITNSATICAVVFAIFINLLLSRDYLSIIKNGLCFIIGFIISVLPGMIYCAYHGILSEMLDEVFSFGYTYASEGKLVNFSSFQGKLPIVCLFIALFPVLLVFLFEKGNRFLKFFVLVDFAASIAAISMGNAYPHYFTMLIPNLAVGMSVMLNNADLEKKKQIGICLAVLSCLLLVLLPNLLALRVPIIKSLTGKNDYNFNAEEIAAYIPDHDKDSVYTYGIPSKWYLQTGLFPCIKYCDWQNHYIALSEKVKEDLGKTLIESPPTWIITEKKPLPDFLENDLREHYLLYFSNEDYCLWQFIS